MKTLQVINASTDAKQIAYRSIEEIKRDLLAIRDSIVKPTNVDNIHSGLLNLKVPLSNRSQIMENLDLIQYYDNVAKQLVSIKAQLTYAFKDKPDYTEVKNQIKELNTALENKMGDLLKKTHSFCWRSLDKQSKSELKQLTKQLQKEYPAKVFLLLDSIVYHGKPELVYRYYIRLSNVKDDTQYVYPHYYILVTKLKDDWYVNTSVLFKLVRFITFGHLVKRRTSLFQDILLKIKQELQRDGL